MGNDPVVSMIVAFLFVGEGLVVGSVECGRWERRILARRWRDIFEGR